jgi:citrate synthase
MTMETRLGLRDVIAGESHICLLDEKESRVYYFGHSIEELVENEPYETVAYLTLFGELPKTKPFAFAAPDEAKLRRVWQTLSQEPATAHPMGLLRTAMSSLGNQGSLPASNLEAERAAALELVPEIGYLVGMVARHASGRAWAAPRADYSYAQNILTLLQDRKADDFAERAMNVALILYTEHEFNAGSFGVRVAASAHSDIFSSVVAGECILRGPRHGFANEEVMRILLEIPGPSGVKAYLDNFFAQPGARLPGFGHAVYNLPQSHDPRVDILRPWVRELSRRKGEMRWYETCLALEAYMAERMKPRVARGNPNAPANMDLWTAPLYYLLGIPIPLYTPLFAASRIAGWCAHYLETRYVNNEPLIRPRAGYVGPQPVAYTPSPDFGATKP